MNMIMSMGETTMHLCLISLIKFNLALMNITDRTIIFRAATKWHCGQHWLWGNRWASIWHETLSLRGWTAWWPNYHLGSTHALAHSHYHSIRICIRVMLLWVWSEWAFDDRWLVEEGGESVLLQALEGIQQHDAVVCGGHQDVLAVVAELHHLPKDGLTFI